MPKIRSIALLLFPIIVVLILPVISRAHYMMHIYMWFCIYCMLATSLRFIMLVGAVNFAHAGFMAIGAYISAALMMRLGLAFWVTFILGGLSSAIFGAIFGLVTLRLRGAYFFLVSFALCEIIRIAFSSYLIEIFGGVNGLIGIPHPDSILGLQFKPGSLGLFYLVAVISIISVLSIYLFEKGYWGNVFRCITESDNLAESVGINILKYKLVVFVIGCFIAGIAGTVYSSFNGVITPDDFTYMLSLFLLVCVVLGGREHIFGAVVGVALFVVIGELFRVMTYFEPILWGFSIIVVLLFAPRGLVGLMAGITTPIIGELSSDAKRGSET